MMCEEHFKATVVRRAGGRYVTADRSSPPPRCVAESSALVLQGVKRRLRCDPLLEVAYRDFSQVYDITYGSHGGVFNASSITSNGRPLNDLLLRRSKLELDILAVLMRCRLPRFAHKADITKIFRQIRVHDRGAHLQPTYYGTVAIKVHRVA